MVEIIKARFSQVVIFFNTATDMGHVNLTMKSHGNWHYGFQKGSADLGVVTNPDDKMLMWPKESLSSQIIL